MKTIQTSNYRVEVYPRTTVYGIKVDEEEDVCKTMVIDINRHVNNVLSANIVCDRIAVCGHCGSVWTEDDDNYNGGCCSEDEQGREGYK